MISLKKRLILTYALFVCAAVAMLIIALNYLAGIIFSSYIKKTIEERSEEIVRIANEQYDPGIYNFDLTTLSTMSMYFAHEGYFITIEDSKAAVIWDAREAHIHDCIEVMNAITSRMEGQHRMNVSIQNNSFPLHYNNKIIGYIKIETYGPVFYTESQSDFLSALNRLLIIAGALFIFFTVIISIFLASAISRPIIRASEAARHIALGNLSIRLDDSYKTKELRELSRSVNGLASELAEGERRQRQLMQDVAHELRTPLTCVQGTVEAMIDGVWEPTQERLEDCREEITRLTKLVEDLNLLTNLEWEKIQLYKTDFELSKLLEITAGQFIPQLREKNIKLLLNAGTGMIQADYDRLKQVFINLISNAVAYTDKGTITINASPAANGKNHTWDISVADTGTGISENELPFIFDRFFRSDKSRNRNTGGSGIGLAIAAAIVKAHGGVITVQSGAAYEGSIFRIAL
jgi:signal transduction histidine kinase